ncbi:sugar efflux transporter [Streptomyces sp. MBT84]|nr:sugar efflux transporter [Streptomyces sp. MBT84]
MTDTTSTARPTTTPRRDRLPGKALLGLFLAGFVSILTECLPAGLLPDMSRSLDTSVSLTGQTVTLYALATALGRFRSHARRRPGTARTSCNSPWASSPLPTRSPRCRATTR